MKSTALLLTLCFISISTATLAQAEFEVLKIETQAKIVATSFINDKEGWLADTINLWHTNDSGASFNLVTSGKSFNKIDFIDELNGFALGEKEAYKTNDGGTTWKTIALESIGTSV